MLNDTNNKDNNNHNLELDRLEQILNKKIKEKKNQIHPLHAKISLKICKLKYVH